MYNIESLEKNKFAYYSYNPNLDNLSKILNKNEVIQSNAVGYYFGEIQIYDILNCFGEIQILNGETLTQYLNGSYDNISLYGVLEVTDTTILNGTLEIL